MTERCGDRVRRTTERLHPSRGGIARAAALLADGGLVAFGTETVYGLGADATDPRAVAAVFAAKDRPRFNPLIVHLPDADGAFRQAAPTPLAHRLAGFWPGPLTLVLPRARDCTVCALAAAGLPTATPDRKGRVDRSDLGIDFKPLQDLETFYNVDIDRGVLVNSVDPLGAAAKAGVRSQDILMSVNGKPTNCRFPEEIAAVRQMIAEMPIGTAADLVLRRGKEQLHLSAKTLRLQSVFGEQKELKVWGLSVREVTRAYASDAQLDDDTGVAVETLTEGHPAAEAELERDDIIHSVDGKPVTDLDEFLKLYKESVAKRAGKVGLDIRRNHADVFKVMSVPYDATAGGDERADAKQPPSTQNNN